MNTTTIIAIAFALLIVVSLAWGHLPERFKAPLIIGAAVVLATLGHLFRQAIRPSSSPDPETISARQVEGLEAVLDRRAEKEITVLVEATEAQDFQALDEALNHDIRRR